jgi:hypothetical protein
MRKYSMIKVYSGAANVSGNATGYSNRAVIGKIHAIVVKYDSSSSALTDIEIKDTFTSLDILDIDNSNTNSIYTPRVPCMDYQGNILYYEATDAKWIPEPIPIMGLISLGITNQTQGKGVTIYLLVEEY